jgi:hypothetical protein
MGPGGREFATSMFTSTSPDGTWATIVGLITLFIGATAVFGEFQTTMH